MDEVTLDEKAARKHLAAEGAAALIGRRRALARLDRAIAWAQRSAA